MIIIFSTSDNHGWVLGLTTTTQRRRNRANSGSTWNHNHRKRRRRSRRQERWCWAFFEIPMRETLTLSGIAKLQAELRWFSDNRVYRFPAPGVGKSHATVCWSVDSDRGGCSPRQKVASYGLLDPTIATYQIPSLSISLSFSCLRPHRTTSVQAGFFFTLGTSVTPAYLSPQSYFTTILSYIVHCNSPHIEI